jgi:GT2 family glycosyltransferase
VPLTILKAPDSLHLKRNDVAVCVPVFGGHDAFVECLSSVLEHTPSDVPILISDDASPDDRSRRHVEGLDAAGLLGHPVFYLRQAPNLGFVANVNDAFERLAPADVAVVNSDVIVSAGWLEALRRAGESDTLVATVSVFTNHGTILSLPHRNRSQPNVPQTTTGDLVAADIAAGSLRLYPRVPTLVGHCFLVKRSALDLVGEFDLAFSPGYGEEVDFAQRCTLYGLVHVVADDAFVVHKGSVSFSSHPERTELQAEHDRMIGVRYPYYYDWVRETELDESGPFSLALRIAQRSFRRLTVAIDGRCLTPIVTGTQVATLELIVALHRRGELDISVVVPNDLGSYAADILGSLGVRMIAVDAVDAEEPADIAHRPYQVSSPEDLVLLATMGNRVVVSHLDLIGFNNPGYHDDYEAWARYRRLTQNTLGLADAVSFISRTAADEAVSQGLVERDRTYVVYLGTDHQIDAQPVDARAPRGIEPVGARPFLLCLGTDFRHKNRVFALRLLHALRTQHAWDGSLVFAGPHVAQGSSAPEEAAFITHHPELRDRVVDVAAVDDAGKRWLMMNATAMVYPSVHEGFGFVPFEAADAGLFCLFAAQTSLAELLPAQDLIERWDASATAERVIGHLRSEQLRRDHVAGVRAAAARLTWGRAAQQLTDVYRGVARQPAREARRIAEAYAAERVVSDARYLQLEQGYYGLRAKLDTDTEHLVDAVPPDMRRPLLALATRKSLRAPLFGTVRAAYGASYRLRRVGRRVGRSGQASDGNR